MLKLEARPGGCAVYGPSSCSRGARSTAQLSRSRCQWRRSCRRAGSLGEGEPVAGCVLDENRHEVSDRALGEVLVRQAHGGLDDDRVELRELLAQPVAHAGESALLVLGIHPYAIRVGRPRRNTPSCRSRHTPQSRTGTPLR